uniref:CobW C-terminal domain-containing protein n=1 Tax=Oncorhynchus tshawytscha TaxID=74940 RepID=A0A8C8J4S5_ONCTS
MSKSLNYVCVCAIPGDHVAGKAHQVMLQGVHELYELDQSPQVWGEEPRVNHLVFIWRNLDKEILQEQFISTVLKVGDRN